MYKYRKRLVDVILEQKLRVFGGCLIIGPKGCGKSTTAEQKAKTVYYFQDKLLKKYYSEIFDTNPKLILQGEKPILYDEWQDYKDVWDMARMDIDKNRLKGAYIFTGSSSRFVKTSHTGTLRISTLQMYPMSLYESGESNGTVSLKQLFDNHKLFKTCECKLTYEDYAYLTCRGGWPRIFEIKDKKEQLLIAKDLYEQTCNIDVENIDKSCANSLVSKQILKSYSRNICSLATNKTIYGDVTEIKDHTRIDTYIYALKKLCIIDNINAWNPNINSRYSARLLPKKNLVDPSIAVAACGKNPEYLIKHPWFFGSLFESLVIRDLHIYAGNNSEIYYYRNNKGLECDAILQLEDGRYALIEIKLGGSSVSTGINNLNAIEKLIMEYNKNPKNKRKLDLPTFKLIITSENKGFNLGNNTIVIPLGCLKD